MFTNILVCSDGSDDALKAAQAAAEIANKFKATVTLLSVFNPAPAIVMPVTPGPGVAPYVDTETVQSLCDAFHDTAQENTGRILEEKGVHYQSCREFGHPVDIITSVAEEKKADLIVMGSRGLGGFQRFLLGSVSDGVLHHAHCPVLIVR